MTSVLVSHPHAAVFANAVATGLAVDHQLGGYVTGVAAAGASLSGFAIRAAARGYPKAANRVLDGVGADLLTSLSGVEMGARLAGRLGVLTAYDAMFLAHDAAVSAMRWPKGLDAVYAFEDAALWTLRRARARGLAAVYDLPIPHHRTLAEMWRAQQSIWPEALQSGTAEPGWKMVRKDRELGYADVVVVASAFTENSVRAAGYNGTVVRNPYGFPGPPFVPREQPPAGPFTVLAVGTQDLRKGTPYLLEAWRKAALRDARLRVIGRLCLGQEFLQRYAGSYEHVSSVPRTRLPVEYAQADLLVFPTLGDGFGMVISESMACGTPVLTTPCGGGPEAIEHGVDGLIIPAANLDALVDTLRWAALHRGNLQLMGLRAAAKAASYPWTSAGRQLAVALNTAVGRGG